MFLNRFRGIWRQSAIRQAIGLLSVFASVTLIAWTATFWLVAREMERLVDARLEALMSASLAALESGNTLPTPGLGQSIAVLESGQVAHGDLPLQLASFTGADGFHEYDSNRSHAPDYRYLVRNTGYGQLVITENVHRLEEASDILRGGLQVALVGSLGATLLFGLWMARRAQARLDAIGAALARTAQGDLGARINLSGTKDDLNLLATRIDNTTARLEQTVEQMRVQSSNIAHDLRTPLARLRALIEQRYLTLVEKAEPVRAEALEDALEQIDRIVGTFDALLRIARIESGARKASFAAVNLDEVVQQIAETFGPVVEDAAQRLVVVITDPVSVHGDRNLIFQLAANLIQNALRYGAEGQTITLAVAGRLLSVSDQGPGIPPDERENVLAPLYQLDRERQSEGYGLGLSMVGAVSELHDARLSLSAGPDGRGLKVEVQFPDPRKNAAS